MVVFFYATEKNKLFVFITFWIIEYISSLNEACKNALFFKLSFVSIQSENSFFLNPHKIKD